jgi:3-dehydroquinate synthase
MNYFTINWSSGKTDFVFGDFSEVIRKDLQNRKLIFICDERLVELYPEISCFNPVILISANEENKSLQNIDLLYQKLIEFGADKHTVIVSIGGGIISDLAGFIAATFFRGMPLVLVPTTLLAMIDAAIGGKNGLNFNHHKNQIGTIRQPEKIIIDKRFLKTLPAIQIKSGMAEVIKHAVISGDELFNEVQKPENITQWSKGIFSKDWLIKVMQVKIKIVLDDEFEKGNRRILNFGHTIGHILEMQEKISHGEAVSIGMVIAAKLSVYLKKCEQKSVDQLIAALSHFNLPVVSKYNVQNIISHLDSDKKKIGKEINYVLMEDIGHVVVERMTIEKLKNFLLEIF